VENRVAQILIIGYGSQLRGDDAIGCRAADELEQYYHDDPDVEVIASHQLTPEMALDISRSDFVLFLDASSAEEPGKISQVRVLAETVHLGFAQQLSPATLLALAEQLYGHAPEAVGISLAGWSFKLSNQLSRRAEMLMPVFVAQAKDVVESRRQISDPSQPGLSAALALVK
jgi:hydrogenase maturation protease